MNSIGRFLILIPALTIAACSESENLDWKANRLVMVERGPMEVRLMEVGELKAASQMTIHSEVEGRSTIIFMVEEGADVKKGDKLVELDASELIDKRARRQIQLARAKARLVQAEQELGILEKEIVASEESAQSKLTIAQMELEKFLGRLTDEQQIGGKATNQEMLQQLRDLVEDENLEIVVQELESNLVETVEKELLIHSTGDYHKAEFGQMAQNIVAQIDQVRLMQADLKIKEEEWRQSEKLFEKNFVNKSDLESDQYEYQSQLSKVTLALNQLELLINYELKKTKIRLSQDFSNASLALQVVKAENLADRAGETADLRSRQAEFKWNSERFENLIYQIEHANIYAPSDGLVVYFNKGGMHRPEVLEEGAEVHNHQALMILPDVSRMVATIRVQEADVGLIKAGQRATIQLDAFKDKKFTGSVRQVAPLPDSKSRYQNKDLKVYMTDIALDGKNEILRPGMSATVVIDLDDLEDVLQVPLQAMHVQGFVSYVWVPGETGPETRVVETGAVNLDRIQIVAGLDEGAQLYLDEPKGIKAPQFPQPDKVKPASAAEIAETIRLQDREGLDAAGGDSLASAMRLALLEKFPDHPGLQQARGWMLAMGDPEILAAIEADPKLKALFDEWQATIPRDMESERDRMRDRRRRGGRSRSRR